MANLSKKHPFVHEKTLLNLGKHFVVDPAHWNLLANRIDQLMQRTSETQSDLFELPNSLDSDLEELAQHLSALALQKMSTPIADDVSINAAVTEDFQTVNVNQIETLKYNPHLTLPVTFGNRQSVHFATK